MLCGNETRFVGRDTIKNISRLTNVDYRLRRGNQMAVSVRLNIENGEKQRYNSRHRSQIGDKHADKMQIWPTGKHDTLTTSYHHPEVDVFTV